MSLCATDYGGSIDIDLKHEPDKQEEASSNARLFSF